LRLCAFARDAFDFAFLFFDFIGLRQRLVNGSIGETDLIILPDQESCLNYFTKPSGFQGFYSLPLPEEGEKGQKQFMAIVVTAERRNDTRSFRLP
jgi:hypothetical protein